MGGGNVDFGKGISITHTESSLLAKGNEFTSFGKVLLCFIFYFLVGLTDPLRYTLAIEACNEALQIDPSDSYFIGISSFLLLF